MSTIDPRHEELADLLSLYRQGSPSSSASRFPNPELMTAHEQRIHKREIFHSFINREITSKEQLGWFIQTYLQYRIPDKKVCPDHYSPLEVIWSIYHDRPQLALWISSRGSGKTRAMSALNLVEMLTRRDYPICHSAAIQSQALRAYNYFRQYQRQPLIQDQVSGIATKSKTALLNGSELETIVTTWSGVNSPHVPTLRLDEVELIKEWALLEEAMFIPMSTDLYSKSTVLISTRKWETGVVQRLVEEAEEKGIKIFISCIFEVLEGCTRQCEKDPQYGDCYGMNLHSRTGQPYCGGAAHACDGFYKIDDFLDDLEKKSDEGLDAQIFCRAPYTDKGPRVYEVDENRHFVSWAYFKSVTGLDRPEEKWIWLAGEDFGVVFAFVLIVLDNYDRAWVVGEYYHNANKERPRLLIEHYRQILQIPVIPLRGDRINPRVMIWPDPSANQEIIEMFNYGQPLVKNLLVRGVIKNLGKYNDVAMGVDELKGRLKPGKDGIPRLLFIKEAVPNTCREFQNLCHLVEKDGTPMLDTYGDEDHTPDCLRYGLYGYKSSRRKVTPVRAKGLY